MSSPWQHQQTGTTNRAKHKNYQRATPTKNKYRLPTVTATGCRDGPYPETGIQPLRHNPNRVYGWYVLTGIDWLILFQTGFLYRGNNERQVRSVVGEYCLHWITVVVHAIDSRDRVWLLCLHPVAVIDWSISTPRCATHLTVLIAFHRNENHHPWSGLIVLAWD